MVLITGAGNTINDYFDLSIDRVNRPDRPLPSGTVTPRGAIIFAGILFTLGILVSLFTNPYCAFFAFFNSLLLIAYAKTLKSTPLVGNISVAYLAGSIFLFGGAFAGISGLVNNLVIALITIFAMFARELLKDAEDVPGDIAAGAKTVPVKYGVRPTVVILHYFYHNRSSGKFFALLPVGYLVPCRYNSRGYYHPVQCMAGIRLPESGMHKKKSCNKLPEIWNVCLADRVYPG